MALRDKLGILCEDEKFGALFPTKGQPALAPWRLCLVTLIQFIENLTDRYKTPVIRVRFSLLDCRVCEHLSKCTKSKTKRRAISIRTEQAHLALQKARTRQNVPDFWQHYKKRAGVEGTLSQGIRSFGLRQSRYRTMAKTNLQHLLVASAINIVRVLAWLEGQSQAQTPKSNFAALAA